MRFLVRMVILAFPCTWLAVKVSELSGFAPLGLVVGVCVWVALSCVGSAGEVEA